MKPLKYIIGVVATAALGVGAAGCGPLTGVSVGITGGVGPVWYGGSVLPTLASTPPIVGDGPGSVISSQPVNPGPVGGPQQTPPPQNNPGPNGPGSPFANNPQLGGNLGPANGPGNGGPAPGNPGQRPGAI